MRRASPPRSPAMTGVNLLYETAGMHASLLGFCLESLLIDNDMLGSINRNVRGIEVNDETLSVDVIRNVCLDGPGHYLGHDQTLSLMQKEYIYPALGNRMSPKEWNEAGRPDIVERATARKREILSTYYPDYLPRDDRRCHPGEARHQAAARDDGAGRSALALAERS